MDRYATEYLGAWKENPRRKPLVMRGARQVGKSYLARLLAKRHFANLLEINFEETPDAADLFADRSPEKIVPRLELQTGCRVVPGETLIFLDEVQAAPEAFACLRFFHEKLPELHIVAAGSLLEFVLEDHDFSMPVGRIEYLHLGPASFEEFLTATGRSHLAEFVRQYELNHEIPLPVHDRLMEAVREFLVVGGMPEAVQTFADTGSLLECDRIKQSILSTYADDFTKYGRRVNTRRLQRVFRRLPHLVGGKFKCSHVDRDEPARGIGQALHMLCLARIAHKVHHAACNGIPLGAEINERKFKALFLDVGLMNRASGLSLLDFDSAPDIMLVNSGAACEQFVGQHLLYSGEPFEEPQLHYWSREKRQSSAEVDYTISVGPQVIPVEVKAGKSGRLKSLHMFLKEKGRGFGLRFNADRPSLLDTTDVLPTGDTVAYRLLSLPLYLIGQVRRLCRQQEHGHSSRRHQ